MPIIQQEKLIGPNFTNWFQNLRIVVRSEEKLVHLEQPLALFPYPVVSQATRDAYDALLDAQNEVACLMLGTFHACKQEEGHSVSSYRLKMKIYFNTLERLSYAMPKELGVFQRRLKLLPCWRYGREGSEGQKEETPTGDPKTVDPDTIDKYYESVNLEQEVACIMLSCMSPDLQRTLEKYNAYDMMKELKTMFEEQAKPELLEIVKALHACKQEEGQSVSSYLLNMKSYLDTLERLGYAMPTKLGVSLILNSLNKDYDQFVQNYNMHNIGKTLAELHVMLKLHDNGIPKKVETPTMLAIRDGRIQKDKKKKPQRANGKGGCVTGDELSSLPMLSGREKNACHDPESEKWLEAMNKKIQSMKDNQVWYLVDLPSNGRTVGCKWFFKMKTGMDGNVHTFKSYLIAKGFTQTYGVDYEETFSPVADIRAIRILLA
ncbi:zinc finger, CCHC-type containing protein [Tanacetum coccineum]